MSATTASGADDQPTFVDRTGRKWPVVLTADTLAEVRALGLDLAKLVRRPGRYLGSKLLADPEKLVAALWVACGLDHADLTPSQFARRLDPAALTRGCVALLEAAAVCIDPAGATAYRSKLRAAVAKAGINPDGRLN